MKIDGIKNKKQTSNNSANRRVTRFSAVKLVHRAPQAFHSAKRTLQSPVEQVASKNIARAKLWLLKELDKKQVLTILATFLITFVVSIATSQGIASMSKVATDTPQADSSVLEAQTISPQPIADLNVQETPSLPDFDPHVALSPNAVYLPQENLVVPDPLKERKAFLQSYLTAHGSVLAKHVDALSEQTQWKLIVAIARAESSFCKRSKSNNCWGIGGAWNLKNYDNYDQAIEDVNRILEQRYIQAGLNSPSKIVNKWVGHPNDNWEAAVQEELDNLKDVQ